MRLIKGGSSLDFMLSNLVQKHEHMAFAVAWASSGSDTFSAISLDRKKIYKAVIGTHFYQTHPDVLDEFVGFNKCHFVLQPEGVFHPKVYLFWSKLSWDLLIGSANLTNGAFSKNTELLLHVSNKDVYVSNKDAETFLVKAKKIIADYWTQGEILTAHEARRYRGLWKTQQQSLSRISGKYSGTSKGKAPVHTKIMSMSWSLFFDKVQADPHHGFEQRCELLDLIREKFSSHRSFLDMELGVRKTIAGLPNDWNEQWGWFGSMSGAGYYHQAINDNNVHISNALNAIPLEGIVTSENYHSYIDEFVQAFPNGRDGVSTASRLLALKRPDQFVCLDSKNKSQLCKDFGIRQSGMDYNRYWGDVICRIMDSTWWNSSTPSSTSERRVWLGRAAMLDAIFYKP